MTRSASLVSGLIVLVCSSLPASAQMLGVTWTGNVYKLDPATGNGSFLGATGYGSMNALTSDCAGNFYSASGSSLIRIDPGTGTGSVALALPLLSVRGLAYNPADGLLYAIENGGGPTSVGFPDDLYTIDLTGGSTTLVGNTGFNGIQGLAFAGGALYGWETGSGNGVGFGLLKIDPATGATVDVNPAVGGLAASEQFLAADSAGQLYTGRDQLYTVNAATGATTLIGGVGYADLRGADFPGTCCTTTTYCTAKVNSCGGTPDISSTGAPSASATSGFVVSGSGARMAKAGLVMYGPNGRGNAPFNGGILCIEPTGLRRSVAVTSVGGTPGNCDASLMLDWNAFASGNAGGNPAAFLLIVGQQVNMQRWGRDTVANGSYLSDGLEYSVCP
jgi:hypothetical protein